MTAFCAPKQSANATVYSFLYILKTSSLFSWKYWRLLTYIAAFFMIFEIKLLVIYSDLYNYMQGLFCYHVSWQLISTLQMLYLRLTCSGSCYETDVLVKIGLLRLYIQETQICLSFNARY